MSGSQNGLTVAVDGALRAGSLWMPANPARSVILMVPGSGPSSRTCDGYFVPIIDCLLDHGHAIAAFDKRGAGQSTGSFADTEIATQTADAAMCLERMADEVGDIPVGVFGHSQGGWVAYELAAQRPNLAFAISNSGPAVGPAAQERALLVNNPDLAMGQAEATAYDHAVAAVRRGDSTQAVVDRLMQIETFRERLDNMPDTEAVEWELEISFMAHEPAAALRDLVVPTMVIHGENDELIPVHESLGVLDSIANPAVQTVLLADANHRLLDSERSALVDGYLTIVTDFVDGVLAAA